jgi:hypothetical protein
MKLYRGCRTDTTTEVTVNGQPLDARLDLRDFHASGFEWGYEGSGPSQLALAILADHAGPEAALGGYRDFMKNVIAEIEDDEWHMTGDDIDQKNKEIVVVPMDLKTLMKKVRGEID